MTILSPPLRRRIDARRIALLVVPPVAAFALANVFYFAAASVNRLAYLDPTTWARWDSVTEYIPIAQHGYNIFDCAIIHAAPPPGWCGNAGWFPGFPALLWLLTHAGLSPTGAGVAIASAFEVATLLLLWIGFLQARPTTRHLLVLLLAPFFFGQVYYHAVFPISQVVFFSLLLIFFAVRERWMAAGLAGFAAAFSYPSAFLWVPATAVWILVLSRRQRWPRILSRLVLTTGLTSAGTAAALLTISLSTGVSGAFFKIQRRFGFHLQSPVTVFLDKTRGVFQGPFVLTDVPGVQSVIVGIYLATLAAVVVMAHKRVTRADTLALLGTSAIWIFPFFLGGLTSTYRTEALVVPSVLVLRHVPPAVTFVVFVVAVALAYPMAVLFFRGLII